MNKIFRISLLIITATSILSAQRDYFSVNNIIDFAEYLYTEKEYVRAAEEYQRLLVMQDSSLTRDSILYRIGICYQRAENYQESIHYFQKVTDNYYSVSFSDRSHGHIVYNYMKSGMYDRSIQYIHQNSSKLSSQEIKTKMNILEGMNYFYQHKWTKAYNHFNLLNKDNHTVSDLRTQKYSQLAKEAVQFPYKNLLLAGIFSAIVPGSGKMYSGNFKDGLYSFIIIGICTWQSYDGFSKDGINSFKGWAYGSVGTIFYLGNIYGSMVAVKIYNEHIENEFIKKVELNFSIY